MFLFSYLKQNSLSPICNSCTKVWYAPFSSRCLQISWTHIALFLFTFCLFICLLLFRINKNPKIIRASSSIIVFFIIHCVFFFNQQFVFLFECLSAYAYIRCFCIKRERLASASAQYKINRPAHAYFTCICVCYISVNEAQRNCIKLMTKSFFRSV